MPIVLDWTNYGTWADIEKKIDDPHVVEWNMLPGAVSLVLVSEDHTANLLVDTEGQHVRTLESNTPGKTVSINLSWYYEHRTSHFSAAADIRDTFFRARAQMKTIRLILKESDRMTHFSGMVFYK